MTTLTIADTLKYANLQMAAEALYDFDPKKNSSAEPGQEKSYPSILPTDLVNGNNRSSKFTQIQATEFSEYWQIVEHKSNTTTGFSGTLFRRIKDDPVTGEKAGALVLSIRSTEFADDAARDNEETNKREIGDLGWAFGQIDDMQSWYESLKTRNKIPADQQIALTGYSLGGHLATAFNLLHQTDKLADGETPLIKEVVTFNGAGTGVIGTGLADIGAMMTTFRDLRSSSSLISARLQS